MKAGKIRFYGVSVERVEEALKAIEFPGVQSVQLVYNIFRQRPADLFFAEARRRKVGILARLPLSSGMLAGKMTARASSAADDHRNFNRDGAAFDRGETFSGVPFEVGLDAVEELRPLVPEGATLATFALRWILMHEAVTCVIPGGKRPSQVDENCSAVELEPLLRPDHGPRPRDLRPPHPRPRPPVLVGARLRDPVPSPRGAGRGLGRGATPAGSRRRHGVNVRARPSPRSAPQQHGRRHPLWFHLRAKRFAGFKFRRQHSCGSYILDFYCPGPAPRCGARWRPTLRAACAGL